MTHVRASIAATWGTPRRHQPSNASLGALDDYTPQADG